MKRICPFFCLVKKQEGQALLIVVLIMVISLTVGLSVISKSITNTKTSSEEENSQRAFSAAEAGIEKALGIVPTGAFTGSVGTANFSGNISNISGGQEFVLNNGNPVQPNDGVDVQLANYPDYNNAIRFPSFSVYWGQQGEDCLITSNLPAAIEVVVVYGSKSNPSVRRYAYDRCASRGNNFTLARDASAAYKPEGTIFRTPLPLEGGNIDVNTLAPNSPLVARITPLYKSTKIVVTLKDSSGGCSIPCPDPLPLQGKKIESTGLLGATARKVQVYQPYPKLPSEFFYILFKAK